MIRLRSGRPSGAPTLAEAEAHSWTPSELAYIDERIAMQAIGDLPTVRSRIDALVADTGADEVIVVPQGPDLASRQQTLRGLAG